MDAVLVTKVTDQRKRHSLLVTKVMDRKMCNLQLDTEHPVNKQCPGSSNRRHSEVVIKLEEAAAVVRSLMVLRTVTNRLKHLQPVLVDLKVAVVLLRTITNRLKRLQLVHVDLEVVAGVAVNMGLLEYHHKFQPISSNLLLSVDATHRVAVEAQPNPTVLRPVISLHQNPAVLVVLKVAVVVTHNMALLGYYLKLGWKRFNLQLQQGAIHLLVAAVLHSLMVLQ